MEPAWLTEARRHIDQKEVPGPGVNAWIKERWLSLKGGLWFWDTYGKDDSKLPWCGMFCAATFKAVGIEYPAQYASAKAWLGWGIGLPGPTVGAVAVFTRDGGGHVGIVVGRDARGYLMVLGGNQGDAVTIAPFEPGRAVGYRWPSGQRLPGLLTMPLIASTAAVSRNEA